MSPEIVGRRLAKIVYFLAGEIGILAHSVQSEVQRRNSWRHTPSSIGSSFLCFVNRRALQRRLRNFLRKHSDEFLDGQHPVFWSEFVSQQRKPARGPSELCTDVSWFAYLSRTQHSQSGERTAESGGSIPRLSMSGSGMPVSQTPGTSSGGPYFPIGVNQTPVQGSATGSGGLNSWPWNPYLWNPLVAMQKFPGGNTPVLSWPPVQGDQALPNFLPLATSKGKGRKRREEEPHSQSIPVIVRK